MDQFTLTVPLDALEAGERHILGERRKLIHILSASKKENSPPLSVWCETNIASVDLEI